MITATVDRARVPCTGAAVAYLASKRFWDNTTCPRLVTEGLKVLQCGGAEGPSFRYAAENLPVSAGPPYPKGTIAMAETGGQFFVAYDDTILDADYPVLGVITEGLDIVADVAKAGSDNANNLGDGHPTKQITIETLTMSP